MSAPDARTDPAPGEDPTSRSSPAAAPPYDDEISLRELYLILRSGLPTIMIVTAVAVAASLAFVLLRPAVYEAETTVVSSPSRIQIEDTGALAFEPRNAVDFATFENLAVRRGTYEATLELLRRQGIDAPRTVSELESATEVERLSEPTNGADDPTPLTIVMRVRWQEPDLAAAYADAWATITVDAVRSSLQGTLQPIRERTVEEAEARRTTLSAAEEAYRAFETKDLPGQEERLRSSNARILTMEEDLRSLDRDIAGLRAREGALTALTEAQAPVGELDASTLDFLVDSGRVRGDVAASLRVLLASGGNAASSGPDLARDATALLARTDLQAVVVALADRAEERAFLATSLADLEEEVEALRRDVAALRVEGLTVQRRLDEARSAYQSVQSLEPGLAFVASLTPANTRVLDPADEPAEPVSSSWLLTTALAAVVAAMAATLFVFLREAVREPSHDPGA